MQEGATFSMHAVHMAHKQVCKRACSTALAEGRRLGGDDG